MNPAIYAEEDPSILEKMMVKRGWQAPEAKNYPVMFLRSFWDPHDLARYTGPILERIQESGGTYDLALVEFPGNNMIAVFTDSDDWVVWERLAFDKRIASDGMWGPFYKDQAK